MLHSNVEFPSYDFDLPFSASLSLSPKYDPTALCDADFDPLDVVCESDGMLLYCDVLLRSRGER